MKKILTYILVLVLVCILSISAFAEAFSPIFGIDVSLFQGKIDWGKVAGTNQEFAILRIGYNDRQDSEFVNNYQNAKAAGIPVGAYMYSYAVTEEAAIEEANIVLERIKGMQFEYPIYLDVEDPKLLKEEYNLTKIVNNDIKSNYHDIFLIDKNNYVAKTTISVKSIEKEI